ncbi:MAG: NAD-dependent epimerase/dehydratase family protein [Bacillota bacterium]
MKIFIIGGTGFISTRLTELLLKSGHEVTVFTRGKTKPLFTGSGDLNLIHGDRKDVRLLSEIAGKHDYDVLYDMIAYYPKDSEQIVDIFSGKTGRIIHCSTISVYMISNDIQPPVTEDQWDRPIMQHWDRNPFGMDYGINKRKCEEVLWNAHQKGKIKVSMIRPTYVSGPNDLAKRDFFWIERIMDQEPLLVPGCGDHAFQSVFVDDVARAFSDLLDNESTIGEAYNITAEEIFSLNDYIRALARILKKEVELVHINQEEFDKLPISYNPMGDVFPFNVRRTVVFSLDKAKRDLKYRSTPFNKWMAETINWYLTKFQSHSVGYEYRLQELQIIDRIRNKKIN